MSQTGENTPELTVVIPCLNEADTVEACVREARRAIADAGIDGEVVVADNGSTDGSPTLAAAAGARVVPASRRGYGAALMAGIEGGRGRYLVMGDADGSYDFSAIPEFLRRLREGNWLVQGCRLPTGGGSVETGAMPWSHRWIGNPGLTFLARLMFRTPVHDVYCGLRGFSRELYDRLDLRCTGMEFATEMIIKAALHRLPTAEVPIRLRRDGRKGRPSHLRTFRDGWRTLRIFLLFSPRWAHVVPGTVSICVGLILGALALGRARFGPATLGAHTLLVAATACLVGQQALWVGAFARTFATLEGIAPENPALHRVLAMLSLERCLIVSALLILVGLGLIGSVAWEWRAAGFGPLDYATTLGKVVPGGLFIALGGQTVIGSFALSLLGLDRRR